ncbi:MAG: rRNA maturation RNase YbeY [Methyloprofundus sp.]|nr:rRNA maturation RNase YbeY [Methyloprofundus sp.]
MDIQRVSESATIPSDTELNLWVQQALYDYQQDAEVLIRVVDQQEMIDLNTQYRNKQGPTNILSFPFEVPELITDLFLLGDLVICATVMEQEAVTQEKMLQDHWAHIIVHGILHLLGYDHVVNDDAMEMEAKEILILQQLNIINPYQEKQAHD